MIYSYISLIKFNKNYQSKKIHFFAYQKKGLRANTLFTIRQISSMWNPDYFKNLNLHLSVYNIPRVLCEFIEKMKKKFVFPED